MTEQESIRIIAEIEAAERNPKERESRVNYIKEIRAAAAKIEAEETEQQRQWAEEKLRDELRREYFRQPAATEEDFELAWPELRRRKLADDALHGQSQEVSADTIEYYKGRF